MTIASIRHVQQDDGNVDGLGPRPEEAPAVRVGGGEAFDDDGADELAVDHALGLVEDDLNFSPRRTSIRERVNDQPMLS